MIHFPILLVVALVLGTASVSAEMYKTIAEPPTENALIGSTCDSVSGGSNEIPKEDLSFFEEMRFTEINGAFDGLREKYHIDRGTSVRFVVARCTRFGLPFQAEVVVAPSVCDQGYCSSVYNGLGTYRIVLARRLVASSQSDLGTWAAHHALCYVKRSLERSNTSDIPNPSFGRTEGCVRELVGLSAHAQFYLQYLLPGVKNAEEQAVQLNEFLLSIATLGDEKKPQW